MQTHTLLVLELVIFNGIFLAWAAWELWSVRKRKDDKSPSDPGHSERQ